jgi:hypothetical protein
MFSNHQRKDTAEACVFNWSFDCQVKVACHNSWLLYATDFTGMQEECEFTSFVAWLCFIRLGKEAIK